MAEKEKEIGFDCSAITGAKRLRVWMPFNGQIDVELNFISRDELGDLRAACTKTSWDRKHHPVEEFDDKKFSEKLGLKAINNWNGPEVDKQPLPCTPENIKLFMLKWLEFAKWVAEASTDLERLVEAEKEAARKNSGNISGQEPTTQG